MYKINVEFRGVKTWEVILALKSISQLLSTKVRSLQSEVSLDYVDERFDNNYEIKGNGWRIKIVKEDVDIRYGIPISVTHVEAEGDKDKVENIIKELKLRLFKASGI